MSRLLGDLSCDLDPKVKVKGQIMYFLENASPRNVLEVATSIFCLCIGHLMLRVLGNISCDLRVKVNYPKVK